jgi:AraC family transcriptional regulator, activator of mtrCDE
VTRSFISLIGEDRRASTFAIPDALSSNFDPGNPAMNQLLDEIFRMIRLRSCVYFQRDFHGPWSMRIADTGFAHFHVISHGSCVLETDAGVTAMEVGDVVVFPRGAAHVLADTTEASPVDGKDVMRAQQSGHPMFTQGGPACRVICGHFEYRLHPTHPLIDGLPDVIQVRAPALSSEAPERSVLPLLIAETDPESPGSASIAERLAEVLLIQVLHAHFGRNQREAGFLSGLMDRRLSRALAAIHRDYPRPLTLGELARTAGMSRTGFSQHFRALVGVPPIEYLTQWRMLSAGDMLERPDLPVSDIAVRTGYDSELTFSRAFKRAFNLSPTQYRDQIMDAGRATIEPKA